MNTIFRFTLLFSSFLSANESFITKEEYASQLYHNPRGIGCHLCHGEKGEGKLIAHFKHKNEYKAFEPPKINSINFVTFKQKMKKRIKGMPRYFLTSKEIETLYFYLENVNEEEILEEKTK
jgi:hypothetical protein